MEVENLQVTIFVRQKFRALGMTYYAQKITDSELMLQVITLTLKRTYTLLMYICMYVCVNL